MSRKNDKYIVPNKKTKIILEMLKEKQTTNQIASKYKITSQSLKNKNNSFQIMHHLHSMQEEQINLTEMRLKELKSKNDGLAIKVKFGSSSNTIKKYGIL